jgi:hypothetical protein
VLPALLRIINPPGEKEGIRFTWLAPVDRFTENPSDSDPHLDWRPRARRLATAVFVEVRLQSYESAQSEGRIGVDLSGFAQDPATGTSAIDLLVPSLSAAQQEEKRLARVPEVSSIMSLRTFIPGDQQRKLAFIRAAAESSARISRIQWRQLRQTPRTSKR